MNRNVKLLVCSPRNPTLTRPPHWHLPRLLSWWYLCWYRGHNCFLIVMATLKGAHAGQLCPPAISQLQNLLIVGLEVQAGGKPALRLLWRPQLTDLAHSVGDNIIGYNERQTQFKTWKCSPTMVWASLYNNKISFSGKRNFKTLSTVYSVHGSQPKAPHRGPREAPPSAGHGQACVGSWPTDLRQNHHPSMPPSSLKSEEGSKPTRLLQNQKEGYGKCSANAYNQAAFIYIYFNHKVKLWLKYSFQK